MLNYLSKLDAMFQYAYHNDRASFYRDLYGDRVRPDFHVDTLDAWRSLPFVTKADLQQVPLLERTFTDLSNADMIRTSSGTSGGEVLMTLRNFTWRYDELFERIQPTGVLSLGDISYAVENGFRLKYPNIPFIGGDLHAVGAAVRLAEGLPINVVGCWLFAYDMFIQQLDRYGLREGVAVVYTFGERVTPAQYVKLKTAFPGALVYTLYGATEIHETRLGYSVDEFDMELGTIFSTSEHLYMELIDPDTGTVIEETGKEGEVVVTMMWTENNPSPLLRYRMGDLAMYTTYHEDPWQRRYATRGRRELDRIRIPGGQLQASEFERAIGTFHDLVMPDFELHYTPVTDTVPMQAELWVLPRGPFDERSFIDAFMQAVRISPDRTYADAVSRGLVPAMQCRSVRTLSREGRKRIRFIEERGGK
ncbi:MAG: hypothetical protein WDZ93_01515 [Candidatus Paceibacterota bacterium]